MTDQSVGNVFGSQKYERKLHEEWAIWHVLSDRVQSRQKIKLGVTYQV